MVLGTRTLFKATAGLMIIIVLAVVPNVSAEAPCPPEYPYCSPLVELIINPNDPGIVVNEHCVLPAPDISCLLPPPVDRP